MCMRTVHPRSMPHTLTLHSDIAGQDVHIALAQHNRQQGAPPRPVCDAQADVGCTGAAAAESASWASRALGGRSARAAAPRSGNMQCNAAVQDVETQTWQRPFSVAGQLQLYLPPNMMCVTLGVVSSKSSSSALPATPGRGRTCGRRHVGHVGSQQRGARHCHNLNAHKQACDAAAAAAATQVAGALAQPAHLVLGNLAQADLWVRSGLRTARQWRPGCCWCWRGSKPASRSARCTSCCRLPG